MANEKIVLAQLELDVSGLLKSAAEAKSALSKITDELLNLVMAGDVSSKTFRGMKDDMERLTKSMDAQIDALKEQIKKNEKLADSQKSVSKAMEKTAGAQENLTEEYIEAAEAITGLSAASEQAKQKLTAINAAMAQNQALASQSAGATSQQAKTFNDYKQQLTDSAQSINIFNGGLGGFISRAQEAGGVGPLVSGAFKGMSEGISGMTKSALAFMATPLGAAIAIIGAVLSPVISYFKNTEEGIGKVTAVTRPLQSVFDALVVVFQNVGKFIVDVFSSPLKSVEGFGNALKTNITNRFVGFMELIPQLGKSISLLFSGKFAEAGKTAANALGKVALGTDNITDKVAKAVVGTGKFFSEAYRNGQKMDELQKSLDKGLANYTKRNAELKSEIAAQNKVANDGNKTFAQREAAAQQAVTLIKEQNSLMKNRLDQEMQLLKLKLSANGLTSAENAQIAEMAAKHKDAIAQGTQAERDQAAIVKGIRAEANTHNANLKAEALKDYAQKQQLEVLLLESTKSEKFNSLKEEMSYNKRLHDEKLQAAQAEFNTTKKTENDRLALQIKVNDIETEYRKNNAVAAQAFAKAETDQWLQDNQSKIVSGQKLTDDIVAEEAKRLQAVKDHKLEQLKAEQGTNDEIIAQKRLNNQLLSDEDRAYLDGKAVIEQTYKDNTTALDKQFSDQKAADKAVENEIALAQADSKYEEDTIKEQMRHDAEVAKLKERKDAGLITEQQYNTLLEIEDKKHANNKKANEKAVADNKMMLAQNTFSNIATIMGKESAAGKAIAIAQATMDTYKAATAAYSSLAGITFVGPALGAIAAAAAVASGIANVKKITSTKAPKAEKGALFSIGGNRHSAGGTMFRGADGTTFEAEQGELIGVMNRNAARHFMAFNNAFPAGSGSAPNYFAGGGIVSREIASPGINTDELAAKIAEANRSLPAPIVAVQDIINEGNSYVKVREGANF